MKYTNNTYPQDFENKIIRSEVYQETLEAPKTNIGNIVTSIVFIIIAFSFVYPAFNPSNSSRDSKELLTIQQEAVRKKQFIQKLEEEETKFNKENLEREAKMIENRNKMLQIQDSLECLENKKIEECK